MHYILKLKHKNIYNITLNFSFIMHKNKKRSVYAK